jgi:hypothetical protein
MRGLDTDQFEELWMTQWQFREVTDLCHLFAAPADVIVSHIGQVCLFVFSLDRVALRGDADGCKDSLLGR